jgi:hypothetical protein
LAGGIIVVAIFMLVVRPLTIFVCALPDGQAQWRLNEMLFMCWTRDSGRAARPAARYESARRSNDCTCHLYRRSHDIPDTGAANEMARE